MEKSMKTTGLIFVIAGVLAMIFPHIAGIAVELIYGVLIACIGLFYLINVLQNKALPARGIQLVLSLLFLVAGALIILMPMKGLMAFTLIIAWAFIIQGVLQFLAAFSQTSNRLWFFLNAIIGVVAGGLILTEWPTSANWLVGLLIGINLFISGLTIMRLSSEFNEISD